MQRIFDNKLWLLAASLAAFMAGCNDGGSSNNNGGGVNTNSNAVAVISTTPADNGSMPVTGNITATFSDAMNASTINSSTFTLMKGTTAAPGESIPGEVTYADKVATFNPASDLLVNTKYTATITTGAMDPGGNALAANKTWSFTTAAGPASVVLGTAGNFVMLAKEQIAVSEPVVSGDIGVSPGTATNGVNGFLETSDSSNTFSTSSFVTGKIYASDYAAPTPATLTKAITDMEAAYTAAAARTLPDVTDLSGGQLVAQTLVPGLYNWSTSVAILEDITLSGGPDDVWIFQIAGDLNQAAGSKIILSGGARPQNIFWQVTGDGQGDTDVYIGENAHFEGILLARNQISLGTKATMNGRLFSQTVITLDQNTVTQPVP